MKIKEESGKNVVALQARQVAVKNKAPDIFEIFSAHSIFSKSYESKTTRILSSLTTEDLQRCSQKIQSLVNLILNSNIFEQVERGLDYEPSDDGLLYFSCLIISQGESAFWKVIKNEVEFWSFFGDKDGWADLDETGEFILTSIDWELSER